MEKTLKTKFAAILRGASRTEPGSTSFYLAEVVLRRDYDFRHANFSNGSRNPVDSGNRFVMMQAQRSKPFVIVDRKAKHPIETSQRTTPRFRAKRNLARKEQKRKKNMTAQAERRTREAIHMLKTPKASPNQMHL
jgi:hypothetical protein